ncbi:MAG TPA: polyprenol monophosphomannose synthase [Chitinophagaceae bacterium]|nr:polyprenol monophosphomannose synthase [Chitinophagaceae bacterium]MCC6635716.1 polyprenol monophosphomannose synthase [Chitinophagaceae bacterium]HMZ45309.1 polyprenol monophosphomannose synthase [Chitinophagaceae bacterium]HNF30483.1 polyprenol monophosphomannose synthase [Chitinophagaceae bacterium]HNJ58764.1 polyprenol monophosphomannose synthase [Chitinophagaceae bacterium]
MEKIVIIPTYNEKENIANILQAIFSLNQQFHVLVIDDGSPDGTAQIVKDLFAKYPNQLFIEERTGKLGLGTAYIHGFKWCLKNGYEFIFEMDADFSHNPKDLINLYNACKEGNADVAIGSRYVPGGKIENWPLDRHIYSRGGAIYTKLITWMPVNDPTAGFVCYKRKVLETINLNTINFVGYAFQIEMKFAAWKLGFKIKEVPIVFIDRKEGVSKMSKGIIKEGVFGVLSMQWQSILGSYNKLKRRK